MKLELKHLAPYLPYKLKIYDGVSKKTKLMNLGQGASNNWVGIKTILNYHERDSEIYMPILKPLIELKGNGDENHELMEAVKLENLHLSNEMVLILIERKGLMYKWFEILLENHFDVFGLIEKGLAIDINSVTKL